MGDALHRGQAETGTRLSEPLKLERSGFADRRPRADLVRRALACRAPVHWLGLGAVAVAAIVADQLTKHVVASELALDDEVKVIGPFTIHHVQNSGIAFGLFASATAAVIVLTRVAVAWMVGYFARSGARHPLLPVAVGLLIGGSVSNLADRIRLGHVTDFLDLKLLARVQPCRQLHRDRRRDPARRARRRRPARLAAPRPASSAHVQRSCASLALRPGPRLDRFLAELPESARAPRPSACSPPAACSSTGEARRRATGSRAGRSSSSTRARRRAAAASRDRSSSGSPTRTSTSLVVDKPAGPRRAPGRRPRDRHARPGRSRAASPGGEPERPGIVHRLDRDTSGLLVVARSEEAYEGLQALVKRPRARARVPGARPRPPALAAAAGSRRRSAATAREPTRMSLDTDPPRDAVTHFEVVELLAAPRAAARAARDRPDAPDPRPPGAIGLPVAGDPVYGVPEPGLRRQFLHAARLAFDHPVTGERIERESPLPATSSAAGGASCA